MYEKIEYSQKIVAFIDILGFKNIVKESEKDNSKLELIYKSLEFLKGRELSREWDLKHVEIEEDAQKKGVSSFDIASKTKCTCFSDSIVISVDYNNGEDINKPISTLIANIANIGAKFMKEGILLRGAIALGNLIHTSNGLIVGQGLIDAYELESQAASGPRIILSKDILKLLNFPLLSREDRYPYHQYLESFADGHMGFHQMIYYQVMQSWTGLDKETLKADLMQIRNVIAEGLKTTAPIPTVNTKYKWLAERYEELAILSKDCKVGLNLNA